MSSHTLQVALINSGLQQYWRRLHEMGYTKTGQVLKLGRGERLNELLELLRPLPGHKVRLLNFIEEERARAQANAAVPPPTGSYLQPMPSNAKAPSGVNQAAAVPRALYKQAANRRPASASRATSTTVASRAQYAQAPRSAAPPPATAEAAAEAAVAAAAAAAHAAAMARQPQQRARALSASAASAAAGRTASTAAPPRLVSVQQQQHAGRPALLSPVVEVASPAEGPASPDEARAAEEAAAVAFLRMSWAREMLSDLPGGAEESAIAAVQQAAARQADSSSESTPRVSREEAKAMGRDAGAAPSAADTLGYTMAFEDDDAEDEDEDEDEATADENAAPLAAAPAASSVVEKAPVDGDDFAAVQLAMRRQLAGLPEAAPLAPLDLPPPPLIGQEATTPRNAPGGAPPAAVVKNAEGADALSASVALVRGGSAGKQRRAASAGTSRSKPASAGSGGNLLANSLDTHAAQRGVPWRPDRRDVYTSVAFVMHQHILTRGAHLLVRSEPSLEATLSGAPTQVASPASNAAAASPAGTASAKGPAPSPVGSEAAAGSGNGTPVGSPGIPSSVRNAFLRGADSMQGMRACHLGYSLELSPVVEQARPSGAPRSRAKGAAGNTIPLGGGGGKFGGMVVGVGEEQFRDEPWAQDSEEEETDPFPDSEDEEEASAHPARRRHAAGGAGSAAAAYGFAIDSEEENEPVDLNDTALWEGGWEPPPAEDFSLFDERRHPLRPGGTPLGANAKAPDMDTVSNYIRSITQLARMGAEASVVALAYVEKLISAGGFVLDATTWRRATLVALLIAHKVWDDDCLENREFARLFGHDVDDLNALERAYTKAIGYSLGVSPATYARYYFALRSIVQETSEAFPLRPLDAELEEKLMRSQKAVSGAALGKWATWLEQTDLSRSV